MDDQVQKNNAKMDLIAVTSDLMPKGKPQFLEVMNYPKISVLEETEGNKKILALLFILVKDFCGSINVVRNMTENQMIEAAAMLLDECRNFRLEDYVMMFAMAKRGGFRPEVKIMDRLDIEVLSLILDAYRVQRFAAIQKAQEETDRKLRLDYYANSYK